MSGQDQNSPYVYETESESSFATLSRRGLDVGRAGQRIAPQEVRAHALVAVVDSCPVLACLYSAHHHLKGGYPY